MNRVFRIIEFHGAHARVVTAELVMLRAAHGRTGLCRLHAEACEPATFFRF